MVKLFDVGWIPVRTAAAELGVTMARVYQLIEIGALRAVKQDATVLVDRASVVRRLTMFPRRMRDAA
jgi:hypothetical protein